MRRSADRALADSPLGRDPALPGPSILGFLACSAVVRKDAFEAVGGFSKILHFRGEEQLLSWDLSAHGWDLCFCPRIGGIPPAVGDAPGQRCPGRSESAKRGIGRLAEAAGPTLRRDERSTGASRNAGYRARAGAW